MDIVVMKFGGKVDDDVISEAKKKGGMDMVNLVKGVKTFATINPTISTATTAISTNNQENNTTLSHQVRSWFLKFRL